MQCSDFQKRKKFERPNSKSENPNNGKTQYVYWDIILITNCAIVMFKKIIVKNVDKCCFGMYNAVDERETSNPNI